MSSTRSSARRRGDKDTESSPAPVMSSPTRRGAASKSPGTIALDTVTLHSMPMLESPDVPAHAEEVVLNARGMPARQRKKNRFYYDDETMVTGPLSGTTPHKRDRERDRSTVNVKHEPIETEEVEVGDPFISGARPASPPPDESPQPHHHRRGAGTTAAPVAPGGRRGRPPAHLSKPSPIASERSDPSPERPARHGAGTVAKATKPRSSGKKASSTGGHKHREENLEAAALAAASATPPRRRFIASPIKIKREVPVSAASDTTADDIGPVEINREAIYKEKEATAAKREAKSASRTRRQSSPIHGYDIGLLTASIKAAEREDQAAAAAAASISTTPQPNQRQQPTLDRKTAHDISIRLRNLLKLPKAHKWVCYEWFYSNIDKVLFEGENDFQICLKESFPQLRARKLSRVEWTKIRRLMGKPRRCSQAFFDEEREELGRRRQKIRLVQQRKMTDFNYKELPDEIPLQLVIGTKVTSRLRKPQDGLFTGTIDGVDTSNNTYRITFDRPGLGTHSIPDYEVLSNDPPETVSTSSFALKLPRRTAHGGSNARLGDFPELGWKSPFPVDGMLGGFPIRLLDMIVRLSKLLKAKREKMLCIKELNVEAEKVRSYGKSLNDDFRIRYARVVVDLESMNREMGMYLEGITGYCLEIAPDHGTHQMIIPEHVQETCRQEAGLLVDTYNTKNNRHLVHSPKVLSLITNLTSLLLQVKALGGGGEGRNLYELKSIKDTIAETKASLEGQNVQMFQDNVEIPMNRIIAGLTVGSNALGGSRSSGGMGGILGLGALGL